MKEPAKNPEELAEKMSEFVKQGTEVGNRILSSMVENLRNAATYLEEMKAYNERFTKAFEDELKK